MSERARILVVDDEVGPRESLRMILKPSYEIATADSGDTALKTLAGFSPDLVFMDIKMPKMDGMELLRRLRQSSDMPVIFLTSKDEEIDEILGFNLGEIGRAHV